MKLPVSAVHEDPELQLRERLDMDRVIAMVEFEEEGGHLPPITVVGEDNLLGDGHHRLAAARRSGKVEIDAERVPGGKDEAIVIAIQRNDISAMDPLTRQERNVGIKILLRAGWTQERIAKATGVHHTTIVNIGNALAMRGALPKAKATGKGGATPKPVSVLPKAVHEKLNDTTLVRIADAVPLDQQQEFAKAVADVNLPEPRVREAIKAMKQDGLDAKRAVESVTPTIHEMPRTLPEVAKQARKRLERFLADPMTIEGTERDFWAVLDVLAGNARSIPLEARGLATLLADVAVKADHYATALRSAEEIEAMA
jgi:DNA invertase Pin-like site-specific DNA recombinase